MFKGKLKAVRSAQHLPASNFPSPLCPSTHNGYKQAADSQSTVAGTKDWRQNPASTQEFTL